MRSAKIEFPNPVLAPDRDDYVNCSFETSFSPDDIKITEDKIAIPIRYDLQCKSISNLIADNKARVAIIVRSSPTSYSKPFRFPQSQKDMIINIPKFNVADSLELSGIVIATQAITNFSSVEFNQLYFANTTFSLRKGDILAQGTSQVIYLDDSELEKPISSIFLVRKVKDQKESIIPDFSGEKIDVNVAEELHDLYYTFTKKGNYRVRRYINAAIIFPVLIEAIARIREFYELKIEDGSDHRRWFRAIEKKASENNIDLSDYQESYIEVANLLLGDIALDALKNFKDIFDDEMDSGESF